MNEIKITAKQVCDMATNKVVSRPEAHKLLVKKRLKRCIRSSESLDDIKQVLLMMVEV